MEAPRRSLPAPPRTSSGRRIGEDAFSRHTLDTQKWAFKRTGGWGNRHLGKQALGVELGRQTPARETPGQEKRQSRLRGTSDHDAWRSSAYSSRPARPGKDSARREMPCGETQALVCTRSAGFRRPCTSDVRRMLQGTPSLKKPALKNLRGTPR